VRAEYQAALAYASHEPALKSDLTALENLRFAVGLKRRISADELLAALHRTGVGAAPTCRPGCCRPAKDAGSPWRGFWR
jgi:ABC-type transport system involved in cytochrome c biogenesis ATPase subunit